jgi:phytoene/squalene synthetase
MVLAVLGYNDAERRSYADATCTGLQLANFWQDVSVDIEKGRIYIPLEDMRHYDVTEAQIERREVTRAYQKLIRFEVDRAQELFERGRRLEPLVDRSARADIRLFRQGGEAILEAIRRANYDTLSARPTIPGARKASLALGAGLRTRLHLP